MRGLAADGFPASYTAGLVDRIWQDDDIIVPRMRVHYTDVGPPPLHLSPSLLCCHRPIECPWLLCCCLRFPGPTVRSSTLCATQCVLMEDADSARDAA